MHFPVLVLEVLAILVIFIQKCFLWVKLFLTFPDQITVAHFKSQSTFNSQDPYLKLQ